MKKTLIASALLSAGLAFAGAGNAFAAVVGTYDFGYAITGPDPMVTPFAQMVVEDTATDNQYKFTLSTYDLVAAFGGTPFVSAVSMNTTSGTTGATLDSWGGGTGSLTMDNQSSNSGSISWDFDTNYEVGGGPNNNRLVSNESVWWLATFTPDLFLDTPSFMLHIQSLDGGVSGKYGDGTPPSVPLPGAAWLFGSALLGFMAVANRRRV